MRTMISGIIKRPVTAIVAIISLVVFAVVSLSSMTLKLMPDMDIPILAIVTVYPGASPEEIDDLITDPISDSCESISGVKHIQADSAENTSQVILQLEYGVNVEELPDVPKYNPEVIVYKVTDENGNLLGIFSSDYFPRSSKRGGAWMNNFRDQYFDADGKEVRPIICNVANFTSPDENGVALLTVDEVETAFHEFGHALHGLLTKCHYPSVSGTSVTRDFVETFSQFNENWAFQPELLAQYAKHYQTGEVIPQELVDKIINSSKFNQGFATTELCAASILDMKWHELSSIEGIDIDEFEAKVCKEMGLIDEIIPRYRTSYFNHIFGGGYSAGYYGYLWAEVIDMDAFAAFEESPNGVWDKELAKKFKEIFLEKGGSEEAMTLFKQFRGREPQSEPFLRGRGLL